MIKFYRSLNRNSASVGLACMTCKLEKMKKYLNPIALRMAKTLWSFGHSECNMVKVNGYIVSEEPMQN